jgi:hypothetical protein
MSVDDARSGRPSTVTCVHVKEQIDQRIRDNQRISIDKNAFEMNVIRGKTF